MELTFHKVSLGMQALAVSIVLVNGLSLESSVGLWCVRFGEINMGSIGCRSVGMLVDDVVGFVPISVHDHESRNGVEKQEQRCHGNLHRFQKHLT